MNWLRKRPMLGSILLLSGGLALLMLIIVAGQWLHPQATPSGTMDEARTQAAVAAQELTLLAIEYPKALRGESVDAAGTLQRAETMFTMAQMELRAVNPSVVDQVANAFVMLHTQIATRAPADEVIVLANNTSAQLKTLSHP